MNNPSDIISGSSLAFDHGIARSLGVNAAIVFNHITYWLRTNALKKNPEIKENKIWMYETQKEISDFLGFMSEDDVFNAIKILFTSGLLIKGNFNNTPLDRRNWYTTTDQLNFLSEKEFQKIFTKPLCDGMDTVEGRNAILPLTESALYIKTDKHHTNKTTTTANAGCGGGFSDSEKVKAMQSVKLSENVVERSLKFTLEEIKTAIECCLNEPKTIENIDGYFMSALKEKWHPKPNKAKIQAVQEDNAKQQQQNRQKIYLEAKQLEITHKYNLKEPASFSVNENTIMLKINKGHCPYQLTEESIKILKKYIKDNKKNVS